MNDLSQAAGKLAKKRWQKVSKKERIRIMNELSKKGVEARKKLKKLV